MAAMTMEREPADVANFMDRYKYDQHQSDAYRRFGGGTSLPLNSDGLDEKRQRLREERHTDWMKQQEKQRKLEQERMEAHAQRSPPRQRNPAAQMDYNHVQEQARAQDKKAYQDYMKQKQERELALRGKPVTPPGGLDIGQYDRQLKKEGPQKKKEYKAMLDQQKDEQLRLRAWERIAEISPGYVKARDEERPLVGSPRDVNYYLKEKENKKDKFRKDLKATSGSSGAGPSQHSSPTPFQDDSKIRQYLEIEREKREQKRRYRDDLLKQKQEHMYLRARQEPEVPVIERSHPNPPPLHTPPHLATKPPPGPSHRPREEAFRTNVEDRPVPSEQQTHGQPPFPGEGTAPNPSETKVQQKIAEKKPPPSPAKLRQGSDPSPKPIKSPAVNSEVPLAFQTDSNNSPRANAPSPRYRQEPPPKWLESHSQGQTQGQGHYYGDQQHRPNPGQQQPNQLYSEPFDETPLKERRRIAGLERKQDYNEYVKHKMDQERRRHEEIRHNAEVTRPTPVVKNAYYGSEEHEAYVQRQRKQLGEEYMDYLSKHRAQEAPRRHDYMDPSVGPYNGGLFTNLGEHGNSRERLNEQRRQDYNERLQQGQRPSGRPNWAKEPLPNDPHGGRRHEPVDRQYEAMLDEKRREESMRRRYDPDASYPRADGPGGEGQYRQGY